MRTRLFLVIVLLLFIFILYYFHSMVLLAVKDVSVYATAPSATASTDQIGSSENSAISQQSYSSSVSKEQESRRNRLNSVCKQMGLIYDKNIKPENLSGLDMSRIYVDDKYKILYCEVPKVACTNWKRILLLLTGKMKTTNPEELQAKLVHTSYRKQYLRTLDQYRPRQIVHRIRKYFKFMFVREPLERLLSAFRSKFQTPYNKAYRRRYARKIISRYRHNASNRSVTDDDDVRFEEFIQFLLDEASPKKRFDPHWRPYYQLCHPCRVQYDFIGKYETMHADVDSILDRIGVKSWIKFPERPNLFKQKTGDIVSAMFANFSSEQIHALWKLYSVDYSMFQYPYPDFSSERHI